MQGTNIASGAKPFFTRPLNDNVFDRLMLRPLSQHGLHQPHHIEGQRIQSLGAIKRDDTAFADNFEQHFLRHYFSKSRAIIIRMISFVPSRI